MLLLAVTTTTTLALAPTVPSLQTAAAWKQQQSASHLFMAEGNDDDVLAKAIELMYAGGADEAVSDTDMTKTRIQAMIQTHPVLLFMKGTKQFPQCGFSDTATKILERLEVEFEAFDVLSDEAVRQGIKEYSQWPTIPQLYVDGEFIGGSDIMLEMYENGELQDVIQKAVKK
jgi:monothiol glutaredoxin